MAIDDGTKSLIADLAGVDPVTNESVQSEKPTIDDPIKDMLPAALMESVEEVDDEDPIKDESVVEEEYLEEVTKYKDEDIEKLISKNISEYDTSAEDDVDNEGPDHPVNKSPVRDVVYSVINKVSDESDKDLLLHFAGIAFQRLTLHDLDNIKKYYNID